MTMDMSRMNRVWFLLLSLLMVRPGFAEQPAPVRVPLDRNKPGATPGDLEISGALATYLANFAKHGDPNGAGVPTWPQFTENDLRVMYFKNKPSPGPVPSAAALEVLDTYFAWRRTPEGEAWAK